MSTAAIVWCLSVMMLAALVQSVGGFGFALLAVPLAAIVIDLTTAVIAVSIASVFNVATLVLRVYKDIDRATAVRFNVPALLGMPFGLVILAMVNQELLKILLGALIVVATVALMRGAGNLRHHLWVDVLAGWLSGILSTSTGTNGPPLVLAAQMAKLSPASFRATLTFTFLVSGPISLVFFAFAGYFSRTALLLAGGSIPLIIIGQYFGLRLRKHVDGQRFERLVYLLLLLSGLSVGISGALS
jgi:uncharacterized membrane protein YfcA